MHKPTDMFHRTRVLFCSWCLTTAIVAQPQASGNLWYEADSRIFFQQAEQPVKATIQGNMLYLEVNAMMNVKADSYLAIFHLMQLGQTAEEADSLMTGRIDRLIERVRKDSVIDADVFTDMLSFVPVYELEEQRKLFSRTYSEVPAGFEIQKNVHIRFRDARVLDKLVSAAAKEEIYDLVKVDYFVDHQSEAYDTLRLFATRLLQKKLDNFAKLGLKVDPGQRNAAEKNGAYFPLDRYAQYSAHSSASLNSKRKDQVIRDVRKPTSLFYNKVPYGNFDIVLHAEITEPPVQYTYNLMLTCQLPDGVKEKEVKEVIKYIWLDDKGDAKTIVLP